LALSSAKENKHQDALVQRRAVDLLVAQRSWRYFRNFLKWLARHLRNIKLTPRHSLSRLSSPCWQVLRRVQSNWTELNWHGLVSDELTNARAGRAHWSLVDAYLRVVT